MSDIRDAISNWRPLEGPTPKSQSVRPGPASQTSTGSFQSMLDTAVRQRGTWNVSQHAQQRFSQRGISLSSGDLEAMERAAKQAEAKGSKNAYMIVGQAGMVVNLPSRTIVTAMDHQTDKVVTQIDSVVVVNKPDHTSGSLSIGDRLNR